MGEIGFRAVRVRLEPSIGEIHRVQLLEEIEEAIAFRLCTESKARVLQVQVTTDLANTIEESARVREGVRFIGVLPESQML